jgi:hypothetical protein
MENIVFKGGQSSIVTTKSTLRNTEAISYLITLHIIIIVSGVRLSPLGTAATTGLLYEPQMIDDGVCGEIGGMKIGRGNRRTRRKPAPAPHDQTRARTPDRRITLHKW